MSILIQARALSRPVVPKRARGQAIVDWPWGVQRMLPLAVKCAPTTGTLVSPVRPSRRQPPAGTELLSDMDGWRQSL
jgi:hypothetical protein